MRIDFLSQTGAILATLCSLAVALPDLGRHHSGTFANPSAQSRPRFRYWIPDASVDLDRVEKDIKDAATVGAGGLELLGYYLYGASPGTFVPVDWAQYGWGTPAWKRLFDTVIQSHLKNDLTLDFAMGPNQGQGVPAHATDEGLMWDLHLNTVAIPLNGSHRFHDQVPGWDSGEKLQAVITGIAIDSVETSGPGPGLPNSPESPRTQVTIKSSSLQDITSKVDDNGRLDITFDTDENEDGIERIIFSVYLYKLGAMNQAQPQSLKGPQTTPTSFIQNGSWTVDHFSRRGAKVITDFWEDYLLKDGTREALMKVGNVAWEDSVEINPVIYWTPELPKRFLKEHGYPINKWYPLLFHQNSLTEHLSTWYITDEVDSGNSHIADYRNTLTSGYSEYVGALNEWANRYLGLQFSAQIGYDMAVDMQTTIPKVDVPETECLAFFNDIDGYRQYTAPANMAKKSVISTECGAVGSETYQQTLPELIWAFRRSLAGSVNSIVIHGYPFSGKYPNTTWPGFTTFTYAFSEMHGRHQPGWDFYSDSLGYIARLQYIFQSGTPKLDVAFYQKLTSYHQTPRNYQPTDLEDVGYTYGYLNPDNLDLPDAYVRGGVLGPKVQAYKAFIVRNNDTMTVKGVAHIARLAKDGLPIIFLGGTPSYLGSYDAKGEVYVNKTLAKIKKLRNVHQVAENLGEYLDSLGIDPLTKIQANGTWYTYWRTNAQKTEDYVFVYSDSPDANVKQSQFTQGTIEFQSVGKPYFLNAWTGEETPVMNYTQSRSTTTIFFSLATNQGVIVAFKNHERATLHAVSTSRNVLAVVESGKGRGLEAHVGFGKKGCTGHVKTSDGRNHAVTSTATKPYEVLDWRLIVEHWDPPASLDRPEEVASKHNTTHHISRPVSWQQINGLESVSGRGYYEATFRWNPADKASGAILSFGPIVHTIRVDINGHSLPPLDTTDATADISRYLKHGENKIQVTVTTTLANVLMPIWEDLLVSGVPPTGAFGEPTKPAKAADYGLLHPVIITPYRINRLV